MDGAQATGEVAPAPKKVQTENKFKDLMLRPATVPILVACYLGLCYLAILAFDVLGIWGVTSWLAVHAEQPLVWWYLFAEKGVTEVLQWSLLAAIAITSAMLAGRIKSAGKTIPAGFWLLIAVTGAVLALEDASTMRRVLALAVTAAVLGDGGYPAHPLAIIVESLYYLAIVSIPVYALVRYRNVVLKGPSLWWILAGYAMYGLTAFASVLRFSFLNWVGDGIDALAGGRISQGYRGHPDTNVMNLFMRTVVEESLEIMAAAFLLAAVVAYMRYHRRRHVEDPDLDLPEQERKK